MGKITLNVAQTVNKEQLQHGQFQVYNLNTLYKGANNNNKNNNNNNIKVQNV